MGFKEDPLTPNVFYIKLLKDTYSKFSASSLARIGAGKLIGINEGKGTDNVEIVKDMVKRKLKFNS